MMSEGKIAVIKNASSKARIERLEAAGIPLFHVEFEPGASAGRAPGVIESLVSGDWLAFADLRAADIFLSDLEVREIDPFALDDVSIYACGEAVSDRLRFAQLHSDLIPRRLGESDVLEEFASYCGEENLAAFKFRVVHTSDHCNFPSGGLREAGSAVELVRLDQAMTRHTDPKTIALLRGGAFDRCHFFSPYDVYDFASLIAPQRMSDTLKGVEVTASDAASVRSLTEYGILSRISEPRA